MTRAVHRNLGPSRASVAPATGHCNTCPHHFALKKSGATWRRTRGRRAGTNDMPLPRSRIPSQRPAPLHVPPHNVEEAAYGIRNTQQQQRENEAKSARRRSPTGTLWALAIRPGYADSYNPPSHYLPRRGRRDRRALHLGHSTLVQQPNTETLDCPSARECHSRRVSSAAASGRPDAVPERQRRLIPSLFR